MRYRISCAILALAAATTPSPAQSSPCDARRGADEEHAQFRADFAVAPGAPAPRGRFGGLQRAVGMSDHAADEPQGRNPYALRRALSLGGLIGTYAATVLAAGAMGDSFFGFTATPVVGPWLTIIAIEGSGEKYRFQSGAKPLLVISGLAQGALLASWLDARTKARRWDRRVLVVPTGSGLGVVGTIEF